MRGRWLLCLLGLGLALVAGRPVLAQPPSPAPPPLRFDPITTADGLSSPVVRDIVQDHQGFIWFATDSGLDRYDGDRFTVYREDPGDPATIRFDDVRVLYEDSDGTLWSHRQLFASVGRSSLVDRLQAVHHQVYGASRADALDRHMVQGVDYRPVVFAQETLDEGTLARFVGRYALAEVPEAFRQALPEAVTLQVEGGELFAVAPDKGCLSLVPIAATRFATPENPDLELQFHMVGDRVEKLTLEAGPVLAVYTPEP